MFVKISCSHVLQVTTFGTDNWYLSLYIIVIIPNEDISTQNFYCHLFKFHESDNNSDSVVAT